MREFASYQAACDWIDDHTSPETAGMFVLERTDTGKWTVSRYLPEPPRLPD